MKAKCAWWVASAFAALASVSPLAAAQMLRWGEVAQASAAQNRAETVARVIERWSLALERSTPGLTREALRETLQATPDSYLLAASVADSLETVRAVLASAPMESAFRRAIATTKALGDPAADLVYTPITPCRLFDTRPSQSGSGTLTSGNIRTYGATVPVTNQGGPGGCVATAGSVVAMILIGTVTPSGNGLLQGGPGGTTSFPNALILFQPGDQYGTAVAMPLNAANGQFAIVAQFASTDAYGDLLGYFRPSTLPGSNNGFVGALGSAPGGATSFLAVPVQLTVAAGKSVYVASHKAMGSTLIAGGANGLNLWICYQSTVPASPTVVVGPGSFGYQVLQNTRQSFGLTAIVSGLPAGTYSFGLCGNAGAGAANWNSNEAGYTTAFLLN